MKKILQYIITCSFFLFFLLFSFSIQANASDLQCTIEVGDSYDLRSIVSGRNVTYSSTNPDIALVMADTIVAIDYGKTEISIQGEEFSYTVEVSVIPGFMNCKVDTLTDGIMLYPRESFQLNVFGYTDVTYTSRNNNIATVNSTGNVTGVTIGRTKIDIQSISTGSKTSVTVDVLPNDGTFMEKLSNPYNVSAKPYAREYSNFILVADAGVPIANDFATKTEEYIRLMERETGFSLYPPGRIEKTEGFFLCSNKKLIIYVSGMNDEVSKTFTDTIYLNRNAADYSIDSSTICHELAHILQRRNSIHLGKPLAEGYAEYYEAKLIQASSIKYRYGSFEIYESDRCADMEAACDNYNGRNAEAILTNTLDSHGISYFFTKYLIQTYGITKFKSIIEAITNLGIKNGHHECGSVNVSDTDILNIIKKETSTNLIHNFEEWFTPVYNSINSNATYRRRNSSTGFYYLDASRTMFLMDDNESLPPLGAFTHDFTKVITYGQHILGKKYYGIVVNISSIGNVDQKAEFYDKNGKCITAVHTYGNDKRYAIKGATKMVTHSFMFGTTEFDGFRTFHIESMFSSQKLSGFIGDNVQWKLTNIDQNNHYKLTLSGSGNMDDITIPWKAYQNLITQVEISNGITHIANYAFDNFHYLTKINLPNSITSIGRFAFSSCISLKALTLPANLKRIEFGAFSSCQNLQSLTIPASVEYTGMRSFAYLDSIKSITFTGNSPTFDSSLVFDQTTCTVYYPCTNVTWTAEKRLNYGGTLTWQKGHVNKSISSTIKATCTKDGVQNYVCKDCGFKGNITLSKTGHKYELVQTINATCAKEGSKKYLCKACGSQYTTLSSQTPHKHKVTRNKKAPTSKTYGYTGNVYCSDCNTMLSEGHTTYKLVKQTITVTKKLRKTLTVKRTSLKKKKMTIKINAKAKVKKISYKVTKGNSKNITVNSKGIITLKKGCKKGTYKILIKAAKKERWLATTKTITIKVK